MCKDKDGNITVDMEDEVVRGATVVKDGEVTWPPPAPKLSAAPPKPAEKPKDVKPSEVTEEKTLLVRTSGYIRGWRPCFAGVGVRRSSIIYGALHGICISLLCRLHGDMECDSGSTYPVNECD